MLKLGMDEEVWAVSVCTDRQTDRYFIDDDTFKTQMQTYNKRV